MNTIGYKVRPGPTGAWTTCLDLGPDLAEDELLTRMSAACGQPVEVCRTVGAELIRQLIAIAREGRACPDLFALLRAEPVSAGDAREPGGFHTADDIKLDLRLTLLPAARAALRAAAAIEKRDAGALKTPVIIGEMCLTTEHENAYRAAHFIALQGHDLKLNRHDSKLGVFLTPVAGGPARRCTTYARTTRDRIIVRVPEDLTGPQRLEVRTRMEASLRIFTYGIDLQPV